MNKLTAIKIKYDNQSYSEEIPIGVLAENVDYGTNTLIDVIGTVNVNVNGSLQDQISTLANNKVDKTYVDSYVANNFKKEVNTNVVNWLNNNINPIGSAVAVDKSFSIEGAAADAKVTGAEIENAWKKADFNKNIFDLQKYRNNEYEIFSAYLDDGYVSNANSNYKILIIPVKSNTNYIVWKNTATCMRIASGSLGILSARSPFTQRIMHETFSKESLSIHTAENDTYLYLQFWTSADRQEYGESIKNLDQHVNSLIVCQDINENINENIENINENINRVNLLSHFNENTIKYWGDDRLNQPTYNITFSCIGNTIILNQTDISNSTQLRIKLSGYHNYTSSSNGTGNWNKETFLSKGLYKISFSVLDSSKIFIPQNKKQTGQCHCIYIRPSNNNHEEERVYLNETKIINIAEQDNYLFFAYFFTYNDRSDTQIKVFDNATFIFNIEKFDPNYNTIISSDTPSFLNKLLTPVNFYSDTGRFISAHTDISNFNISWFHNYILFTGISTKNNKMYFKISTTPRYSYPATYENNFEIDYYLPEGNYIFYPYFINNSYSFLDDVNNDDQNWYGYIVSDNFSLITKKLPFGQYDYFYWKGGNICIMSDIPKGVIFDDTLIKFELYKINNNNIQTLIQNPYYQIPSYFETQLENAIIKINDDINGSKANLNNAGRNNYSTESFIFITDTHWGRNKKHSPGLIKKILENTPIRTVINGGDIISGHTNTKAETVAQIQDFNNAILNIPCYDYFGVFGNHDDNTNSQGDLYDRHLSKKQQYNILYQHFINYNNIHWSWDQITLDPTAAPIKNDYYIDHPITKTRFLCIDWTNPWTLTPTPSNRSLWIQNVLSKNDDYHVIIIFHGAFFRNKGKDNNGEFVYFSNNGTGLPTYHYDDIDAWLRDANGNYINEQGQQVTSDNRVLHIDPNTNLYIYNDDTNAVRKKLLQLCYPYRNKIIAYFMGHAHGDGVLYYNNDETTPIILTSCDTFEQTARVNNFEEYTTDEQCFDAVVVDYYEKKIKLTRIGRHSDSNRTVPGHRNNIDITFDIDYSIE